MVYGLILAKGVNFGLYVYVIVNKTSFGSSSITKHYIVDWWFLLVYVVEVMRSSSIELTKFLCEDIGALEGTFFRTRKSALVEP